MIHGDLAPNWLLGQSLKLSLKGEGVILPQQMRQEWESELHGHLMVQLGEIWWIGIPPGFPV